MELKFKRWIMQMAMLSTWYCRTWRRPYRKEGCHLHSPDIRIFGFARKTRTGDVGAIIREILRKKAGARSGCIIGTADLENHVDNISHQCFEKALEDSGMAIEARTAWMKSISNTRIELRLPGMGEPVEAPY